MKRKEKGSEKRRTDSFSEKRQMQKEEGKEKKWQHTKIQYK